jgi:hypothetical protein
VQLYDKSNEVSLIRSYLSVPTSVSMDTTRKSKEQQQTIFLQFNLIKCRGVYLCRIFVLVNEYIFLKFEFLKISSAKVPKQQKFKIVDGLLHFCLFKAHVKRDIFAHSIAIKR